MFFLIQIQPICPDYYKPVKWRSRSIESSIIKPKIRSIPLKKNPGLRYFSLISTTTKTSSDAAGVPAGVPAGVLSPYFNNNNKLYGSDFVTALEFDNLLVKHKIIDNLLGEEQLVADLFNNLHKEAVEDQREFYFADTCKDLNEYSKDWFHQWRSSWLMLQNNYFSNPWSVISFIAATIVVVLTIVQTLITLHYYPQKSNKRKEGMQMVNIGDVTHISEESNGEVRVNVVESLMSSITND
ncbi:hypothetical protein AG4045_005140 [Apium graveolens]|uniref:Transmembrane protein n=1 Tax=Apium graveolens TaxID=4045 RepID=A0A6L5BCD1_APIGR|nr:hypothetical protein AG4045_005140 [Apium graveolens]